ncbi:MAG: hypothetical protein KKD94_02455 [Nanoarchaeota archaeon]|nr:hypothetical protein [Nanoarchaeota archaeon]MBU1988319.1 hypothetical protein [Nanoarchaeota archaeon]
MTEQISYEELADIATNLHDENQRLKGDNTHLHTNLSAQSTVEQNQQNLIQWQLDIQQELEFISHQLRGHVIKRDDKGNEFWAEPEDDEQRIFNERGAQEIEKVIRNYLIKNVLLSNYGVKEINQRVEQFANRLRRFIFLNFEEFGMDSPYKQKHFEMIVMKYVIIIKSGHVLNPVFENHAEMN